MSERTLVLVSAIDTVPSRGFGALICPAYFLVGNVGKLPWGKQERELSTASQQNLDRFH
jgi:hypothetical protein